MALPYISISGDARARGAAQGEALRERIGENLAIYFERFARETLLPRDEVLSLAEGWGARLRSDFPEYFAAMEGLADAGGFDLREIVALNVRYEILYYQFGKLATQKAALAAEAAMSARSEFGPGDGCTAFALLPDATADGHTLCGQNWDWIPEVRGAIVHTTFPDGFQTLTFTEAGIVGPKIGLNSAGIGLAINGMTTTDDDWQRPVAPFHVRTDAALRARTLDAATSAIIGTARACAGNFLLARAATNDTPATALDLEVAPDVFAIQSPEDGVLTHANHFVDPDALGIAEPPNDRRIFSRNRASRLCELLSIARPNTIESVQTALKDRRDDPFGLSRHRDPQAPPEQHYTTVTAIVMDLDTKTLHATDGPPDSSPFQTHSL